MSSAHRIHKIVEKLNEVGLDAFMAHHPNHMGYLADFFEGFHERFGALVIHSSGKVAAIVPSLSVIQAKRSELEDVRGWEDGQDPLDVLEILAKEWAFNTGIVAVDDSMPARQLLQMQNRLIATLFREGGDIIASVMSVKDAEELKKLKAAGAAVDAVYHQCIPQLKVGMTELEIQELIESELRTQGVVPAFCIVGIDAGAAESHHINGDKTLQNGSLLLLDFGGPKDGYYADITRVLSYGPASQEVKDHYKLVYKAHMAGVGSIKIGTTGEAVDIATRTVITEAGLGKFFNHRTGHGVGMNGHESPNIVSGNTTPLQVGNCFSIEPGIYLEGKYGIRLENLYTVSESGAISFNEPIAPEILEISAF